MRQPQLRNIFEAPWKLRNAFPVLGSKRWPQGNSMPLLVR
jgi:hypothetical protein